MLRLFAVGFFAMSCHPSRAFGGRVLLSQLEVYVLDELLVQLKLLPDEGSKLTRSAACRLDSLDAQPGDDVRTFRGFGDGRAQFDHNVGRRPGRRHEAEPPNRLVFRDRKSTRLNSS